MVRSRRRTSRRRVRSSRRNLQFERDKIVRTITYSGSVAANSTVALTTNVTSDGPQKVIAAAFKIHTVGSAKAQLAVRGEGDDKIIPSRVVLVNMVPSWITLRPPRGEGYTTYNKGDSSHLAWLTSIGGDFIQYVATIKVVTLTDIKPVSFRNIIEDSPYFQDGGGLAPDDETATEQHTRLAPTPV